MHLTTVKEVDDLFFGQMDTIWVTFEWLSLIHGKTTRLPKVITSDVFLTDFHSSQIMNMVIQVDIIKEILQCHLNPEKRSQRTGEGTSISPRSYT